MACLVTALGILSACATGSASHHSSDLEAQDAVRSSELAFARAMAERDFDAFASHLSPGVSTSIRVSPSARM
jgi:hypothetical protein